ncbi:MAG: response regulator, partial [Pseudomonadota bacterium]
AEFLSGVTEDFQALQGRRRLINLPPRHLQILRQALRLVIRDAKRHEFGRLLRAAEALDLGLEHIEVDAHGYSQRFELRRLFDEFLDEARNALAEVEAGTHQYANRNTGLRPKVLVIDDDTHVHRMIERLIGRDVEVLNALNSHGALATLETHRPDLIVLDVELPDIKGTELLRQIKADPRLSSIPVVMMSNNYDDSTVVSGLVGGALDYLSKDMKTIALRPRLMEILTSGRPRLAGTA